MIQCDNTTKKEYDLATSLIKHGQPLDALDRFKRIVRKSPSLKVDILISLYRAISVQIDNPQLYLVLAEFYIFIQDFDAAFDTLCEAVEDFPDNNQFFFLLSKIYKHLNDKKHVLTVFETAFSNGNIDSTIIDLLPKIYLDEKNFVQGIWFFRELINIHGQKSMQTLKPLSEFLIQAEAYDDAAELFLDIVKESPDDVGFYINQCERLLKLNPDSTPIREALIQLYVRGFQPSQAVTHLKHLIREKALTVQKSIITLKDMLAIFPQMADIKLALADSYIQDGQFLYGVSILRELKDNMTLGDLLPLVNQIFSKKADFVPALMLCADCYISENDPEKAIVYLEDAIESEDRQTEEIRNRLDHFIQKYPRFKHHCRYLLARLGLLTHDVSACESNAHLLIGSEFDLKCRLILAQMYEKEGNLAKARGALFECVKKFPFAKEVHSYLISIQNQMISAAISGAKVYPSVADSPPENVFQLGILYLANGLLYKALDYFQKLATHPSFLKQSQILISRCFIEMGRYDLAISQLQRLLAKTDEYDQKQANSLRVLIAIAYFHQGETDTALNSLEKIIEFDVNFPNVQSMLSTVKAENMLDMRGLILGGSVSYLNEGGPDWSLMVIHNTENDALNNIGAQTNLSFAYPHNNDGIASILKDNIKTAEQSFKLAIQLDPTFTAAYCNLAMLHLVNDEADAAHSLLDQALTINPKHDAIFLTRALIYYTQEEYKSALSQLESSLRFNPNNPLTKLNLGDVSFQLGDTREALSYWRSALKTGVMFPFVHRRVLYLNRYYDAANQWTDDFSLKFFEDALDQNKTFSANDLDQRLPLFQDMSS